VLGELCRIKVPRDLQLLISDTCSRLDKIKLSSASNLQRCSHCANINLCIVACRIKVPRDLQLLISDMCSRLNVDGLRGDLVVNRAVKALVAYEGRTNVSSVCSRHSVFDFDFDQL
jgi:hypothetical protein